MRLRVVLWQRALRTSELLSGVVVVHATSAALLSSVAVSVEGRLQVFYTTRDLRDRDRGHGKRMEHRHHPVETFYETGLMPCYDERHRAHGSGAVAELSAGYHAFPFAVRLPLGLPTSFRSRNDHEQLAYYAAAVARRPSGAAVASRRVRFAVVAAEALAVPRAGRWTCGDAGVEATVEACTVAELGSAVRAVVSLANRTDRAVDRTVVTLFGHHQYRNAETTLVYSTVTLPPLQPGCSVSHTVKLAMPLDAMPDAQVGKLNWQHFIHVVACSPLLQYDAHVFAPVAVVSPLTAPPAVLTALADALCAPRDFSAAAVFLGAHTRFPPQYRRPPTVAAGCEELATPSGAALVVDHVARAVRAAPPGQEGSCAYPCWQSAVLPPGWTLGSDRGETFFVNHVEGYTSWVDPSPPHLRAPPASLLGRPALDITALRGAGLRKGNAQCYALEWRQLDGRPEKVKTEAGRKTLDPVWEAGNVMRVEHSLRARNNVVVYIRSKGLFWDDNLGCVDIDLTYLQANVVVEQWFPVSNGNDPSARVSGDVLLRLHLHDLAAPIMTKCPHVVVNSTSSFIVPWHEGQAELPQTTQKGSGEVAKLPQKEHQRQYSSCANPWSWPVALGGVVENYASSSFGLPLCSFAPVVVARGTRCAVCEVAEGALGGVVENYASASFGLPLCCFVLLLPGDGDALRPYATGTLVEGRHVLRAEAVLDAAFFEALRGLQATGGHRLVVHQLPAGQQHPPSEAVAAALRCVGRLERAMLRERVATEKGLFGQQCVVRGIGGLVDVSRVEGIDAFEACDDVLLGDRYCRALASAVAGLVCGEFVAEFVPFFERAVAALAPGVAQAPRELHLPSAELSGYAQSVAVCFSERQVDATLCGKVLAAPLESKEAALRLGAVYKGLAKFALLQTQKERCERCLGQSPLAMAAITWSLLAPPFKVCGPGLTLTFRLLRHPQHLYRTELIGLRGWNIGALKNHAGRGRTASVGVVAGEIRVGGDSVAGAAQRLVLPLAARRWAVRIMYAEFQPDVGVGGHVYYLPDEGTVGVRDKAPDDSALKEGLYMSMEMHALM
eukprot:m51a1_g7958 hypothetical protein (1066) ;mRNA; f:207926-217802